MSRKRSQLERPRREISGGQMVLCYVANFGVLIVVGIFTVYGFKDVPGQTRLTVCLNLVQVCIFLALFHMNLYPAERRRFP